MIYAWYKIFNLAEFEAKGLPSFSYTVELEDRGQFDILVTKGNLVSIIFESVMLPMNFNSKNPFEFDGHASYIKENGDVYLGIEVPGET
jgi:hypothetical protein